MIVPTRAVRLRARRERFSVESAISLRFLRKARAISTCRPTEQPLIIRSSSIFWPHTHSPLACGMLLAVDRPRTVRSPYICTCTAAFFISTHVLRANLRLVCLRAKEQRAGTALLQLSTYILLSFGYSSGSSIRNSLLGLASDTFTERRLFLCFVVFFLGITISSSCLLNSSAPGSSSLPPSDSAS